MRAPNICRRLTRFASAALLAVLSCSAFAQAPKVDRLVFFGASLTDTGNSFIWLSKPANQACGAAALNVPPYDALDDLNIPDGVYAKGGHHVSNGATWAEGLARSLALAGNARPAFANPGQKASNYAVGGARAVLYDCRFNLPQQINTYLADFPQTSADSWMAMEIGGNDVRDALVAAFMGEDPIARLTLALGSVSNSVVTLYASGARKFLLLNVPDIGKTPAVSSLGVEAVIGGNQLSMAYNAALAVLALQLMQGLPGSDIRILDIYDTLNKIVTNPGTYGFANATEACVTPNQPPFKCAKPDSYVFWDGIHPTKAVHDIIAQQAIAAIAAP